MSASLHLVYGRSASGSLKVACAGHGLPGQIFTVDDDLPHGPFNDGRARANYFRALHQQVGDAGGRDDTDAFQCWRELREAAQEKPYQPVVIWGCISAAEWLLVAGACWWLRECAANLWQVCTPTADPHRVAVAAFSPAELTACYESRHELKAPQRERLAQAWATLTAQSDLLRGWDGDQIKGFPADHYDTLLLAALVNDWQPALQVIGRVLGQISPEQGVSDLFLGGRLCELIRRGKVTADSIGKPLARTRVRRG